MVLNKANAGRSLASGLPAGQSKHGSVANAAGETGIEAGIEAGIESDPYATAQVVSGDFAEKRGFGGNNAALSTDHGDLH